MSLPAKRILPGNLPFVKSKFPSGHRFFQDCQRETYGRWIEWSMWSGHPKPGVWFATLTFKTFIDGWRSYKLLNRWIGHLIDGYQDRTGFKGRDRLRWIIATELQVRSVVHYHLLISGQGLDLLSRKRWELRWEAIDRISGFCRIHDADRKAAPYLAKYLNKTGCELKWGGGWRGLNSPNSLRCCSRPTGGQSVESITREHTAA
jgi:hypothetical protein